VFSKSGTVLYGPVPINTLWSSVGGNCHITNDGYPMVLYDSIADRWLISQFSVTNGPPYQECVAVSKTPDPTGAYWPYAFVSSNFPDYPQLGVWPDAYYATFNIFTSMGAFVGPTVCVYDRAQMLLGNLASQQCFALGTNYSSLLPADLDGPLLPPAGAPN